MYVLSFELCSFSLVHNRNSKTSQEVVDFVYCRLKEKVGRAVPTQQHLTEICESVCVSKMFIEIACGPLATNYLVQFP